MPAHLPSHLVDKQRGGSSTLPRYFVFVPELCAICQNGRSLPVMRLRNFWWSLVPITS